MPTPQLAMLLARGHAALWLEQMIVIEESVADPACRWQILRLAIESVAHDTGDIQETPS